MEVCEILLSDSSDDLDNFPTFAQRVAGLKNTNMKKNQRKTSLTPKKSVMHAISDSEESDFQEHDVEMNGKWLSYEPGIPVNNERNPTKSAHSSSDDELPDLNISGHSVEKVQDENAPKDTLELDDLPDLDDVYCRNLNMSKKNEKPKTKVKCENRKDIEKEQKKLMREGKKQQKQLEKALKDLEKEILNSQKPTECLKNMKIVFDHNLLQLSDSQQIFDILDSTSLKHGIEENIINNSVIWYRSVSNVHIDNNKVVKEEREEPTNVMILVIPNEEFLKMIHSSAQKNKGGDFESVSFDEFIVGIKNLHPEMEITCVTIGFEKFMRDLKEQQMGALKMLAKQVHKDTIEQVMIELQLQTFINFHFLNKTAEFGNLLCQFTKAVAEAPLRRQKQQQKSLAFSWYADIDSNCPVKLGKDSSSFIKLWRQQIQQFQNVGPEVAEAIVSRYPSPRLLLKAYRQCSSSKEAENLLQDIVVRRNYGPLGTQKRIGPELSYKLYLFFTSKDGFQLLKR